MNIVGIIPSRYASTRFPGKPLIDIGGKTMIERVVKQASKSKMLSKVIVATDDERILQTVQGFGGSALMTSTAHTNGTERCAEVARKEPADYYINIQGDEPFIDPSQIDALCKQLDGTKQLATLIKKIEDPAQLDDPHVMKVLADINGIALYFSRACVPYVRDFPKDEWLARHTFYKHIGIYAYRSDVLQDIVLLPKGLLEQAESLEQLRWIAHGYKVHVTETPVETVGIDTPEDVKRAMQQHNIINL